MIHQRRIDLRLVSLLFLAGLLLRLNYLISSGFDGLYGQDAYAYYDFAGNIQTFIQTGQSLPPFFWPLGYPALLALGFTLLGPSAAVGQTVTLLMGAALAPLVYILARQMRCGIGGGFTAGLLMAVCGQSVQSSLVLMADTPALFWLLASGITLMAYFSSHPEHKSRPMQLAAAVLFLSMACLTRWLYLALIPVWGAALLLYQETRWRDVGIAGIVGLLVLLPQLTYSLTNPYPILNHAWVQGWSPFNAFQHEFANIDGYFLYEQPNALFYAQPCYAAYYLAPLFTPFILVGLLILARRKPCSRSIMLAGWLLLPYLFLIGIPYQNIRFPLIMFPAVALLAGIGLEYSVQWLAGRVSHRALVYSGATLLVAVGAGLTAFTSIPIVTTFIASQQDDKAVIRQIAERLPPDTTVYTFGLTLALRHYTDFEVYELYHETPETLKEKWQHGRIDYLLVDPWNINSQWKGREPQIAMQWFEDQRVLTRIGNYSHYVLYRIGA